MNHHPGRMSILESRSLPAVPVVVAGERLLGPPEDQQLAGPDTKGVGCQGPHWPGSFSWSSIQGSLALKRVFPSTYQWKQAKVPSLVTSPGVGKEETGVKIFLLFELISENSVFVQTDGQV